MKSILIDAGPLIALFDRNDQYHLKSIAFIEDFEGYLWTTWPVITEVMHLLSFNVRAQHDFLIWISRNGLRIFDLQEDQIYRIIELTDKFDDVPMDLADASLMVVSELTGYTEIASIDGDFYIYRDIRNNYLQNIFL